MPMSSTGPVVIRPNVNFLGADPATGLARTVTTGIRDSFLGALDPAHCVDFART